MNARARLSGLAALRCGVSTATPRCTLPQASRGRTRPRPALGRGAARLFVCDRTSASPPPPCPTPPFAAQAQTQAHFGGSLPPPWGAGGGCGRQDCPATELL
ncbi:MAG: hypothetical protein J3K34DRAFT_417022 [Monoraphidium minutum]|nr:MAG: hypothetical protein J3K34DRAFT_417022 [Monoraphidium minutum]